MRILRMICVSFGILALIGGAAAILLYIVNLLDPMILWMILAFGLMLVFLIAAASTLTDGGKHWPKL